MSGMGNYDQERFDEIDKLLSVAIKSFDKEAFEYIKAKLEQFFPAMFGETLELRLVLDTSALIPELISYVKKGESYLLKLIESPFLSVYAPNLLLEELEEKIPEIAKKKKLDEEKLKVASALFLEKIVIEDMKEGIYIREAYTKIGPRDPNDTPFVAMCFSIRSNGILTRDKDFTEVSEIKSWDRPGAIGKVITVLEEGSFSFLLIGPGMTTVFTSLAEIGSVILRVFLELFSKFAQAFSAVIATGIESISGMPDWLKITMGLALIFIIFSDKYRNAIIETGKELIEVLVRRAREVLENFYNFIKELLDLLEPMIDILLIGTLLLLKRTEELIETFQQMERCELTVEI